MEELPGLVRRQPASGHDEVEELAPLHVLHDHEDVRGSVDDLISDDNWEFVTAMRKLGRIMTVGEAWRIMIRSVTVITMKPNSSPPAHSP